MRPPTKHGSADSFHLARRSTALLILFGSRFSTIPEPARAIEVAKRTDEEKVERGLYSPPAPERQSFSQQVADAITIKSMRGVWSVREYDQSSKLIATGTLTFRGADSSPDKGTVVYIGEAASGRGPWLLKADGFGRNPMGPGGVIEQKALWKLRRPATSAGLFAGTFTYEGRVKVPSYTSWRPDATVEGPIVELVNGGNTKGGYERRVGRYEATLLRLLTEEEEKASSDSAQAGGAPEAMKVICLASNAAKRCSRN
jgi:hypothetical protein